MSKSNGYYRHIQARLDLTVESHQQVNQFILEQEKKKRQVSQLIIDALSFYMEHEKAVSEKQAAAVDTNKLVELVKAEVLKELDKMVVVSEREKPEELQEEQDENERMMSMLASEYM